MKKGFTPAESAESIILPKCVQKTAFTLAEVLITLGIIGVVAAMTLPSLIADYQKKVYFNQFKRSYSNMFNALKLMQAQIGYTPQCYYTYDNPDGGNDHSQVAECEIFYNELTKRMNVIKTCKGNAYRDGCIPKYNGVDTIEKYHDSPSLSGCGGFGQSRILNNSYAFVFNDGSIIFTYQGAYSWASVFAVDVNGKKGPNKWGYDVFAFSWAERKGNNIILSSTCSLTEEGGVQPMDILNNAAK